MKAPGRCKWCGKQLTADNAYASKNSPTGLQGKCKECDREWGRRRNSLFRANLNTPQAEGVGRRLPPMKICKVCCGLPHRVEGERCVCGLPRGDRPMEES